MIGAARRIEGIAGLIENYRHEEFQDDQIHHMETVATSLEEIAGRMRFLAAVWGKANKAPGRGDGKGR